MTKDNDTKKINIILKKDQKVKICTCGESKKLPYCDHTHREHNEKKGTNYKSIKIIPKEDTTIEISSKKWIQLV
ncbi:CDGSH iron-sulfur domain-containing protein [archaeon]|nr:CDGSH iron-sulfur domain-containing protein [archaeon]